LVLAPFADVAVARQGVVVGAGVDGEFLGFNPAGGLAVSVGVSMAFEAGKQEEWGQVGGREREN